MADQEGKSFAYTLILGVCMLLCLLMIGHMLLGRSNHNEHISQQFPPEQEENAMNIRLTEQDIRALLLQTLPIEPDDLTVKIGEDGTVSASAMIHKQTLQKEELVSGGLRTALLFLPEQCKLYGCWKFTVLDGKVESNCTQAEIAGFSLPKEVRSLLSVRLGDAVNQCLEQQKIRPEKLLWENGVLYIQT